MNKIIGYLLAAIVLGVVVIAAYAGLLIAAGYFLGIGLQMSGMK